MLVSWLAAAQGVILRTGEVGEKVRDPVLRLELGDVVISQPGMLADVRCFADGPFE